MEQRKGKRQLNQGVRVKRTEEKEKRADRSVERTREATAVRAKRTTESRAARGAKTSLGQKLKAIHGKVRKAVHESRERNFPESNGCLLYTSTVSQSTGLTLYLHYEPVGINNWSVVLGVSEQEALAETRGVVKILYLMSVIVDTTIPGPIDIRIRKLFAKIIV